MIDDMDLRIIRELQGELPLSAEPYRELASKAGCTVEDLLLRLKRMRTDGSLKRIGAILRHRDSGFVANGLFVCVLSDDKIDEAGHTLADYPEVSHCYRRPPHEDWPYNLYAMIHGHSESEVLQIVNRFVREQAVEIYDTLFSTEELKKSSFSL